MHNSNTESECKYVSIEEIEFSLPYFKKLIDSLQQIQKAVDLLETVEITIKTDNYSHNRHNTKFNKAFHRLCFEFYNKIDELEKRGGMVRDLEEGIVDFYYKFEGRDVLLCWKHAEDSLLHWHEIDAGFEDRKKILDLN